MDSKTELALSAVIYGCASNRKIEGAYYVRRYTKEKISFDEALEIVCDMIPESGDADE